MVETEIRGFDREWEAKLSARAALKGDPFSCVLFWRDVRVVEGARLEGVCARESTGGSNPPLSVQQLQTVTTTWRFVH